MVNGVVGVGGVLAPSVCGRGQDPILPSRGREPPKVVEGREAIMPYVG